MGKKWWKKASGLSNAQRKASRKLGFRLSRTGCSFLLAVAALVSIVAIVLAR